MENTTVVTGTAMPMDPMAHPMNVATRLTLLCVAPIILILGMFGNTMSFITFRRPGMKSSPTCFLLKMLAIADLIALVISCLPRAVASGLYITLFDISNFMCKADLFCTYTSMNISCWLLVVVTFERLISVWKPLQAKSICTLRVAKLASFVVLVTQIGINLPIIWIYALVDGTCKPVEHLRAFWEDIFIWVDLTVYFFAPFILITLANLFIIVILNIHEHKRQKMSQQVEQKPGQDLTSITRMLVIVDIAFLLTASPVVIFNVFVPDSRYTEDPDHRARMLFARTVCDLLAFSNNALNFYLYCLTGTRFRKELLDVFASCCGQKRPQNNAPIPRDGLSGKHENSHI